jgi:hypothetical protein
MGMGEDCAVSVGCALLGGHPGDCAAGATLLRHAATPCGRPDCTVSLVDGEVKCQCMEAAGIVALDLPPQVTAPHTIEPRETRPMHGHGFDYARLDPGIRRLVAHLRTLGIPTTDSGDGVSKPAGERALDVPHVFAVYNRNDWRTALADAERVGSLLPARDGSEVTLAFNAHDKQLVLAIVGYGDGDLP